MSRTVTKSLATATVYALDATKPFETDSNGLPIANLVFNIDGNPTANRARIAAQKAAGHKNVMVMTIDVDETKVKVSPATFYANSSLCKENESYGREYITQTFKLTKVSGFYIDDESGNMTPYTNTYFGVTTDSKLLKAMRDTYGMTAIVTSKPIVEERRYMARDKYMELATVSASESESESESENA